MAFLGQEEQIRELQDRFRFLYAIVFVCLGILLSRLVYLQILKGDQMRRYSEENRIKRVKVAAPRGMIFDRNRVLLIDNRPSFDLEIVPQYLKESGEAEQVLALISKLLKVPVADLQAELDRARNQPTFMPVKVRTDLTRDEVAVIESWRINMPGVEVRQEIKRTNVHGDVAAHLLGYIGEVSQVELPRLNKKGPNYKLGDGIGKFGLEQMLEDTLRGADGEEIKEVDALGRIKLERGKGRVLAENVDKPAVPGKNLVLTIDQDLQLAAVKAFQDYAGSMVAIDPRTGAVLAMISRPAFDPTEFSRGIPTELWKKLLNNERRPLGDKTIQDHYPPGSTFKIFTAIAGLEEGVIDESTTFHCSGNMRVGNRTYHCWAKRGHGNMNVVSAITQSCDVYFFRVAQKLKSVDDLAKWAFHLGFGKKTGIPLAREIPGLIPTEAWKLKRYNQPWNLGETLSVAIGQSFVLTTALQLANAYAGIANGGTLYRPYLVQEVESSEGQILKRTDPEFLDNFRLKPKTTQLVKQGLWGAVNSPHGTGYAQRLPGMDAVGKTGTAQVMRLAADKIYSKCENMRYKDRHHGLFVSFAPVTDPLIAVAVIAEHACHGASAAAPVARAVIKRYLEKTKPELFSETVIAERLKAQGKDGAKPFAELPRELSRPSGGDEEDVIPGLPAPDVAIDPHPAGDAGAGDEDDDGEETP